MIERLCSPLLRLLQRACLPRSQPSLRVHFLSWRFLPWVASLFLPGYCQVSDNNLRVIDYRVSQGKG